MSREHLFVSVIIILLFHFSSSPFNQFIIFKPRTVSLSDSGLAFSFRGLSGLMPEPSFVGTCLAPLYPYSLLAFLTIWSIFFHAIELLH